MEILNKIIVVASVIITASKLAILYKWGLAPEMWEAITLSFILLYFGKGNIYVFPKQY